MFYPCIFPIRIEEDWLSVANWEISRAVRVLPRNRGQKEEGGGRAGEASQLWLYSERDVH